MNYPLGTAIIGFASAGPARHRDHRAARDVPADARARSTRAAFARRLDHLMTVYDPAITAVQLNLLGSHDAPRAADAPAPATGPPPGSRCSSSSSCPARRASTTATSSAMEGGNDPDCRRAFPVDPAAGDRELRAFVAAHDRGPAGAPAPSAGARSGCSRPRATASCLLREADGQRALVVVNAGTTSGVDHVRAAEPVVAAHRRRSTCPGWDAPSLDPQAVEGRRRFSLALPGPAGPDPARGRSGTVGLSRPR